MVPGAFFSPGLLRLLEEEGQNKRGGTGKGSHRCTSRLGFNSLSLSLVSELSYPSLRP